MNGTAANPTNGTTSNPTTVATLVGTRVVDENGQEYGRVQELAVDVGKDSTQVYGLLLTRRGGGKSHRSMVPVETIRLPHASERSLQTVTKPERVPSLSDTLLLERDLLDQQIIDVNGRKVVRVNDVNLAWERGSDGEGTKLRIEDVEIGMRGALRRLLRGLPTAAVEGLVHAIPSRVIPWSCVDVIDRDPARRVRLKIGQDRLAKLHPSDIADILEELPPAEREAVFTSLPEETAAETLEEIRPKLQKELLQSMDRERAADIVEEMDPGAAADLLGELSEEQSEAILEEMEPEERHDVEELLEFSAESAAGRMTTDYISVARDAKVADAITALRAFEGDPDTISEIYLLDREERLDGVVMLPRLLLAQTDAQLASLAEGHNVSCALNATDEQVAELFDKYNLRSLPVVDVQRKVAGVIHAEQVIAQLRER
ncbi:MAG TPA: CBS domain-containing protein [Acidobacteriaceae bacterium]|jgi:sporulation protein YlmC with PRC-barrel domain/CBS domain-containing protein|nr:CBS domain-containing protein [Acidobacteriaceae bacterium]